MIILFSYHFYALDDNIDAVQSSKSSFGLGLVVGLRGYHVSEMPHWLVVTDVPWIGDGVVGIANDLALY